MRMGEEEAEAEAEHGGAVGAERKTRTPHSDVGNKAKVNRDEIKAQMQEPNQPGHQSLKTKLK